MNCHPMALGFESLHQKTNKDITVSSISTLCDISISLSDHAACLPSYLPLELLPLYELTNGLIAFESSLLVLPTFNLDGIPSLSEWNQQDGWRINYDLSNDLVFFGMNVYAEQFGIGRNGVVRLNPETGELSDIGNSLEDWAHIILRDFNFETGYEAAHDWQLNNSPLETGFRLMPKRPFVLGGAFEASNLVKWPLSNCMQQYASLYKQIANIEDGKVVTIKNWLVTN